MNGCVVRINEDRLKLKYHFVEKTRFQRERERASLLVQKDAMHYHRISPRDFSFY